MAAKPGNVHVIFLGMREQSKLILEIKITIPLTDKVKLLGIITDPQLKCDNHTKALSDSDHKTPCFSTCGPLSEQ